MDMSGQIQTHLPGGQGPLYPPDGRLGAHQIPYGRFGEHKTEDRTTICQYSARRMFTVTTGLC